MLATGYPPGYIYCEPSEVTYRGVEGESDAGDRDKSQCGVRGETWH